MRRMVQSWCYHQPASHIVAERLGKSQADHCRHPSFQPHCYHLRSRSRRHEYCPACQLQSKRKSSVVRRIQRAEQRLQRPLQLGGVHRNCRPGHYSPAVLPYCCEHRPGTPTNPSCKAGFLCSPH